MTAFVPVAPSLSIVSSQYNNVYMDETSQLTSSYNVVTQNSTKLTLPSMRFGNTSRVELPSASILGHTVLCVKIRKSDIPLNGILPATWGYDMIRYLEYQFANSRERLRYRGKDLFIKNIADCESGEKKKAIVGLSGDTKLSLAVATSDGFYEAYVSLYLPFSNVSSTRVLPFDSSTLSSPVTITIELEPADRVVQYSLAAAPTIRPLLNTLQFNDAYISCKTMMFADGVADSIRSLVGPGGNRSYEYGFIYPVYFTDNENRRGVSPSQVSFGGKKLQVKLDRFINAPLMSIDVFVERMTLGTNPDRSLEDSVHQKNAYIRISDIELIYSGMPLYRQDDKTSELLNISEYPTSTSYDIDLYEYRDVATPAVPVSAKGYYTHIQLSQLNERYWSNVNQCGLNLANNSVLLSFFCPELDEYDPIVPPPLLVSQQPEIRVSCIYNYSASVRVARGESNFVFAPQNLIAPSMINSA